MMNASSLKMILVAIPTSAHCMEVGTIRQLPLLMVLRGLFMDK